MLSRTPGESSSRGNIHRRRTKGSIEFRGQRTGEASQTELPQRLSNRELARAIYTVCRRRKIKSAYVRVCVYIYICCISGKERNGPRHPILPRDESGADNGRARAHTHRNHPKIGKGALGHVDDTLSISTHERERRIASRGFFALARDSRGIDVVLQDESHRSFARWDTGVR